MCSIKKTYIPEKYKEFWDQNYKDILFDCGADYIVFNLLVSIGYTK